MDNVYQIIRNNIQRGKFKHALELYEVNGEYLHAFKEDLIHDLFTKGIEIENEEPVIYEEVDPEVAFDYVEDELDEIPAEVLEAEEEKLLDEYEEIEKVVSVEEIPVSRQVVQLYQVQPLLNHPEPQHEYFLNYQECLNNGEFEDARIWLAKFDRLLKDNNLRKRLSHHFYKIDAAIKDKNSGTHAEKEKLYNQAYNFMMNKSYESAIEYLELYISLDENINIKGYILLGKVHALNGDYEEAIRNYIYANSISPDPDAHYFLGEMYFKKRRWHEAIFSYLAYNEFYPKENATVYLNLSECYKRIGRTNKVVKYLKIAEEINVEQKMGLYLKNRILKAEQISKRKDEHFQIQRNSNMSTIEQ